MDFRDIFQSFMRMNEDFDSFFNGNAAIEIVGDLFDQLDAHSSGRNVSPRELMLKKNYLHRRRQQPFEPHSVIDSFLKNFDDGGMSGKFHSESFVQTFSSGPDGTIQEKIIIRDSEGNEKIITRSSGGDASGQIRQTEVNKVDGQIVAQTEIASDIGDDLSNINIDLPSQSQQSQSSKPSSTLGNIFNWFRPK